MKITTHFILLWTLFFFLKTAAIGQILRGHVFQYLSSGDSVALAGVQIGVVDKPLRTQSKADGSFQLFLHGISEGQKIQIHIEKSGWRVLNDTVLKSLFRVENGVQLTTVFLCPESAFSTLKTPFHLTNAIQKTYEKRLDLLNHEWAIFTRTRVYSDIKRNNILTQKEDLMKRQRFLVAHTIDLSKLINLDNQSITDKLAQKMLSFLQNGNIEQASNIINQAQYKTLKQKYLKNPHDTHRLTELCLLAFLKAQCAMMQFNAVQADYYFNESLGLDAPQAFLYVAFYDAYIQFLAAFDEPKKVFETIQTLLIKANMRQNTEGVAYAYFRLQDFYFDKKLYDLAQKAGQKALSRFDTLVLIEKKEAHNTNRTRVMRQLAVVYAQQDILAEAIKWGEKSLLSPSDSRDLPQIGALRLVLAQAYQKLYEQTGVNENRQKALFQLSVLQKEFEKNDKMPPFPKELGFRTSTVKSAFEQFTNLKSYIEDMHKPRFLSKKQEIWALETAMKQCKTTAQTIFYRSQIISLLQKLNNQLPRKSLILDDELAHHYHQQALAQIEQQNFRAVEANALQAIALGAAGDNLLALLATAQWLQNKKLMALMTYKTVKDSHLILKTINDFEKKGIQKSILDALRLDFGRNKQAL